MKNKILTVTLNPCIDKTITIDDFKYGGLNRVIDTRIDAAGKCINVSRVIKSFDSNVLCYTIYAGDGGRFILNDLKSMGIDVRYTECDGETRTNIKLVDVKSRITTEINEKGFFADKSLVEACFEDIGKLLEESEIMILSGSTPQGFGDNTYARLIRLAKNYGVRVIVDADGDKLKGAINEKPYAIKPNISEFEELCGKTIDSDEKLISEVLKIAQKGIELVVISMGADGALFSDGKDVYMAKPLDIECKSTVGAGDSMVAFMAYAIKNGYDLRELSELCTAAGSITCSKEGTQVCTCDEVIVTKL
jgi:1-phosphofructokinase